jgi:putative ABC transport system permease protein
VNSADIIAFTTRSVMSHRLRSTLTALGIAIGVAAVVLLTSLGEGLNQFMLEEFSQIGTNSIGINPGRPGTFGISTGIINTVRPLTIEDGEALARLPQIKAWTPVRAGVADLEGNKRQRTASIMGVGPGAPIFFGMDTAVGEFLPPDNPQSPRPFVVLGAKVRQDLFGDSNPLGQRMRIGGSRFQVIGVMESRGNLMGFDLDDLVFIPAARALELFNTRSLMEIDVQHFGNFPAEEVVAAVKRTLIARHGHEDFSIVTQQQVMETMDSVLGVLKFAVAALGSISLLVGGVGIFTIMTIAVRERRPEIGLLRAIGSTRRDIQELFLAESIVLACLGGLMGLVVGAGGAQLLGVLVPALPVSISMPYLLGALGLAVIIGLVAGVLPAHRAAALEPLEALRAE